MKIKEYRKYLKERQEKLDEILEKESIAALKTFLEEYNTEDLEKKRQEKRKK